ncbi:MAG: hypothetical protein ABI658_17115 [Acidimicrobiales bacterium]
MARFRWFGVVGATLLVVVGCSGSQSASDKVDAVAPAPVSSVDSSTGSSATARPSPALGVARIQTADGLLTIDLANGKSSFVDGLVNADWTRVASVDKGVARLVDAASREELRRANVPDGLHVAAISADGRFVAYSESPEYGLRGIPKARTTTRVAVVASASARDAKAQVLDLPGNLVPEAFSSNGRLLYVLDYVPAAAPDHYEVRTIDLVTGITTDVGSRLKEPATEQMQGNARTSLYSPDRQMLFTLYSEYGEQGKAFIHALNLSENWSFCIDLPDSGRFGDGQATLAMSRDNKLYVLGDSGQIAQVDAQPYGLTVERTVQLPAATPAKNRPTAAVEGSRLIVGHDDRVFFLDRSTLRIDQTITMPSTVVGLTGDGNGRVAIATPSAIDIVDQPAVTRRAGLDTKLPVIMRFDLE